MKLRNALILCMIAALGACAPTIDTTEFQQAQDNQIKIESGKDTSMMGSAPRYIRVSPAETPWKGAYAGGEPLVEKRKALMLSSAERQATILCGNNQFTLDSEPEFIMLDTNPAYYGNGLLGYAIASGISDYENLPTELRFRFYCPSDER